MEKNYDITINDKEILINITGNKGNYFKSAYDLKKEGYEVIRNNLDKDIIIDLKELDDYDSSFVATLITFSQAYKNYDMNNNSKKIQIKNYTPYLYNYFNMLQLENFFIFIDLD
jgi:anti-anti-sigma regulatory factor